MPNLYSIQFEVTPLEGHLIKDVPLELLSRIAGWMERKYRSTWKTIFSFPMANESASPVASHTISHQQTLHPHGELIRISWAHPADSDALMRWATEITIARAGERIQFALQVGATSTSFVVKPVSLNMGRPRIVSEILTDYRCFIGTYAIQPCKVEKQASDIPNFVRDVLLNLERSLPVVIVSRDSFTDHPCVDANLLQTTLLGFANVVVVDKWAAFQLTNSLGKALSCYNGCVRVYWPKFSRSSDPMRHELYFPVQIQKTELLGKPLDRLLFDILSDISALRHAEGETIAEISGLISAERIAESERSRVRLQQGAKDAGTLQDLLPVYDLALEENAKLIKQTKALEKENRDLADSLKRAELNWSAFQEHQAITFESEPEQTESIEEFELDSVFAAIEHAITDFSNEILILDSAIDSAKGSEFARPDEVYQALMAIKEVGAIYFESSRSGTSMGGWGDQLTRRGFLQYSPTESDTVKNDYRKYGRFREFVVDGAKRKIYQHLDLGGGDRKNCIQIYFEADRKLGQTVIAYCGEHLPFPRQRS